MYTGHKQSILRVLTKNPELASKLQSADKSAVSELSKLSKVPEHLLTDNEVSRLLDKLR